MQFLPDPGPHTPRSPRDRPLWSVVLFGSAAVTVLATRSPWVRVKFEALFGGHFGPPAWQSSVGFTCLCTSLMVAVMAMAESGSPASQRAVRPGSLLLAAIALFALVLGAFAGPGHVRGVSATWTPWFYVACASFVALFLVCLQRWAVVRQAQSSSGPPT